MKKLTIKTTGLNDNYPKIAYVEGEFSLVPDVESLPGEYTFMLESMEEVSSYDSFFAQTSFGTIVLSVGDIADPLLVVFPLAGDLPAVISIYGPLEVTFDAYIEELDFSLITLSGAVQGPVDPLDFTISITGGPGDTLAVYLADSLNQNELYTLTIPVGTIVGVEGETLQEDVVLTFFPTSGS